MRVKELFAFIKERHAVYVARAAGAPKPWTKDPILQRYRFCNVYRELDKVTLWIRENWREPNATDPDLWFAMLVSRMYNLPATLSAVGYPVPYAPRRIRDTVNRLQRQGATVFNGAYMVRCDCQQAGKTKTDYLIEKVFGPAWKDRAALRPRKGERLESFHSRLLTCYGLGSFMAAQIVADTKFAGPLKNAEDWQTWAAPGPGSERGLNRVCKYDLKSSWKDGSRNHWLPTLHGLMLGCLANPIGIDRLTREAGMPRLSAQDLQNCLCEFDKYERARLGQGRPKQLYPGV